MINVRQLGLMIFLSRVSVMAIFLPVVTAAGALEDAPLAALGAGVIGIIAAYILSRLSLAFPRKTFSEAARTVLGKPIGTVAGSILAAFFFMLAILRSRQLGYALTNTILRQAPVWIIAIPVLLVGIYGALLGTDTLARSSEVLVTLMAGIIVTGLVLALVSGVPDVSMLQPILSRGIEPVAIAMINPIFWFATSASITVVFMKFCDQPEKVPRTAVWATAGSATLLVLLSATSNIILGPRTAQLALSPVHGIARTIFYRGILERLDIMAVSIWVLGITFDVALFFLAAVLLFDDATGVANTKALVLTMGAMGIAASWPPFFDIFFIRRMLAPETTGAILVGVHIILIGGTYATALFRGMGENQ